MLASEGFFVGSSASCALTHMNHVMTISNARIRSPATAHVISKERMQLTKINDEILFTKSYKWKKQRWKKWITRRLLFETMCFWRCPTVRQLKVADRRMGPQQKLRRLDVAWQCSDYSLLFPCSISFAESFVTCLRNKAHVYLLTYLRLVPLKFFQIYRRPKLIYHRTSERC